MTSIAPPAFPIRATSADTPMYEIRRAFDDTVIAVIGPAPLSNTPGVDWDVICREVEEAGESMADIKYRTVNYRTGQMSPWERGRDGETMCLHCDGQGSPTGSNRDCIACDGSGIHSDDYELEQARLARGPEHLEAAE